MKRQQYSNCTVTNTGNSNQYDGSSSTHHLLCIHTNPHVLDTILLCLHIGTSAVASAKPSVAAMCAVTRGRGICTAVERPVPTTHEGKPTFPVIKLKSLCAEKLLCQAQCFTPKQAGSYNSKTTCLV